MEKSSIGEEICEQFNPQDEAIAILRALERSTAACPSTNGGLRGRSNQGHPPSASCNANPARLGVKIINEKQRIEEYNLSDNRSSCAVGPADEADAEDFGQTGSETSPTIAEVNRLRPDQDQSMIEDRVEKNRDT